MAGSENPIVDPPESDEHCNSIPDFFQPIFVSLEGSKNGDSTVLFYTSYFSQRCTKGLLSLYADERYRVT